MIANNRLFRQKNMHELSIALSIIKIVLSELEKNGIRERVERIRLHAGAMHAVLPDSLQFHFGVAKGDHPALAEAELEIVEIPVRVRCHVCQKEEVLHESRFLCSHCDNPVQIVEGEELRVDSIDVEEPGEIRDGEASDSQSPAATEEGQRPHA